MPRHLIDYIRHPESLDAQALTQLRALVDRYPYYQAARIMYLRTLYQMHDPTFDGELRRAAVCLPSRKTLYELFEGQNLSPENPIRNTIHQKTPKADTQTKEVDSTEEFLTGFLDSLPSANATPEINVLDAHQDYMEWFVRSGRISKTEDDAPVMGQTTIAIYNKNQNKIKNVSKHCNPDCYRICTDVSYRVNPREQGRWSGRRLLKRQSASWCPQDNKCY